MKLLFFVLKGLDSQTYFVQSKLLIKRTTDKRTTGKEFCRIFLGDETKVNKKYRNIPIAASAEVDPLSLLDVHHSSPISKPRPAHEI